MPEGKRISAKQSYPAELTDEDVRQILLDILGMYPEKLILFAELYLLDRMKEEIKEKICSEFGTDMKNGLNRMLRGEE